ncbi:MAG: hypothetical protein DBX59_09785 [Bacillota bacterium]|nr:MAG: hypothetical protein DBX59_09785 [Bacillota bacterium]
MEKKFKLGVIGCGFMASAIIKGILKSGILSNEDIIVSNKEGLGFDAVAGTGVHTTYNNEELAKNSEFVFLAIKPQGLADVMEEIGSIPVNKIISILAGVKKAKIKETFPCAKVARCMPNTPCSIGYGAVAVDAEDFDDADKAFILRLFSALGTALALSETKMDAVTGISGSGPAYVYLFIKGLVAAGMKQGLTEEEARSLAVSTVIGSGYMVLANEDKTLDMLIDAVCSKGGTTIEAVKTFHENKFTEIIDKAVEACVNRSIELGGGKIEKKKPEIADGVTIYTDGACSGNPGIGGWGAVLMSGGKVKEISGGEDSTTNNRMELTAVIEALKALKKPCKVNIYTDSTYVADAFLQNRLTVWQANGWRTSAKSEVKNIDLWEELLALTSKHRCEFFKVKGHADNPFNNRCDELAVAECKKRINALKEV